MTMSFRRRQRSRQHQAAHAGDQHHTPPLVHALVPQGEAELVVDAAGMARAIEHLRQHDAFAFDTEFIGEVAYLPRTCLVQLATSERVILIDPLQVPDLGPVWDLVGEPGRTTLVHAGASDLSPVRRHLGREPVDMLDVQVAAAFTGMPYPASLAKLVERFTGHPLSKGHTFTDWDARPLSASQLCYAADDVRYLPLVWQTQRETLEPRRLAWAAQESVARLEDPHQFDVHGQARRAARGYDLDEEQERLLEALCVVRDEVARIEDLPHRAAVPDGALLEMVRSRPVARAAIADLRGFPRPIAARHGDRFVETIVANPSKAVQWFTVRRRREDEPGAKGVIDALLLKAHQLAEAMQIAPSIALTRADLGRHYRRRLDAKARGEAPPPLFAADNWRREAFGDQLEAAEWPV